MRFTLKLKLNLLSDSSSCIATVRYSPHRVVVEEEEKKTRETVHCSSHNEQEYHTSVFYSDRWELSLYIRQICFMKIPEQLFCFYLDNALLTVQTYSSSSPFSSFAFCLFSLFASFLAFLACLSWCFNRSLKFKLKVVCAFPSKKFSNFLPLSHVKKNARTYLLPDKTLST